MEIFTDVYICAAKFKSYRPQEPFFPFQLGTDSLENFFSLLRATHNTGSLDTHKASIIQQRFSGQSVSKKSLMDVKIRYCTGF